MTRGILIYAHNNRTVDYALLAVISGSLAQHYLQVPVSLVTDQSTQTWMQQSHTWSTAEHLFDHVILVDRPVTDNTRLLRDGAANQTVPFVNTNRSDAYALSPYDRTLLIDSDFLILSDTLNQYWDVDADVMLGAAINDIDEPARLGYLDLHVSDTGVKLYWATTVMFSKTLTAKIFFDKVHHIKQNYTQYADVFRFDPRQFRNDIAFSVAKHILDGHQQVNSACLPAVLSAMDRDTLHSVDGSCLTFLLDTGLNHACCLAAVRGLDIHVMNKHSLLRNQQQLMALT